MSVSFVSVSLWNLFGDSRADCRDGNVLVGADVAGEPRGCDVGGVFICVWWESNFPGHQCDLFGERGVAAIRTVLYLGNAKIEAVAMGGRGGSLLCDDDSRWRSANGLSHWVDRGGNDVGWFRQSLAAEVKVGRWRAAAAMAGVCRNSSDGVGRCHESVVGRAIDTDVCVGSI